MDTIQPDPEELIKLANYRMPFGKYKGRRLLEIPEDYFVWFARKGYPTGKLGEMMQATYEIKVNGLEGIFNELKDGE